MMKMRFWISSSCVMLACLSFASNERSEQVFPGIWKIHFGTPERLTPLKYRSAQPMQDALTRLPATQSLPINLGQIHFSRSARGCTVEFPMAKSEKYYGLGLSTNTFELSGRKAWVVPSDRPEESTNESHAPEPFFVSSRGYGVYIDT